MTLRSAQLLIQCRGRDERGGPVLPRAISVPIVIRVLENEATIAISPQDCPHNTGSHGGRCKASHPGIDKRGEGVLCPYAIDLR